MIAPRTKIVNAIMINPIIKSSSLLAILYIVNALMPINARIGTRKKIHPNILIMPAIAILVVDQIVQRVYRDPI
jgi:hypothetical protein